MTIHDIPEDYDSTIGAMNRLVRQNAVGAAGDPARAAAIVVQAAEREHPPTHLLVGVVAVEMAIAYSQGQIEEATTWAAVGRSADFAEPYPVPLPMD